MKEWTSTLIVPIPKIAPATKFSHFRPISLCNFTCKVIPKILTPRLTSVQPNIVCKEQCGLVKGRIIHDNTLLAQELIHDIKRLVRGSNVAIKLGKRKAYDFVYWFALVMVVRNLGFSERWIDMIWRNLNNSWYSVLINGQSLGLFYHKSRP